MDFVVVVAPVVADRVVDLGCAGLLILAVDRVVEVVVDRLLGFCWLPWVWLGCKKYIYIYKKKVLFYNV